MSKNLHQRIAEAMGKVTYIQKERKQGMRYTIVSHDAVTAKVRPALLEAGVIYYPVYLSTEQIGNRTHANMVVRFANIDDPSDYIDVNTFGYGIDDQDKGPGKAMSYAVKYALLKTLGLETGDDPDLDQDVTYKDPCIEELTVFSIAIATVTSVDELTTLLATYQPSINRANAIDPAKVAMVKQAYAKKKKELTQ
jgi:hypothetical protein